MRLRVLQDQSLKIVTRNTVSAWQCVLDALEPCQVLILLRLDLIVRGDGSVEDLDDFLAENCTQVEGFKSDPRLGSCLLLLSDLDPYEEVAFEDNRFLFNSQLSRVELERGKGLEAV